MVMLENDNEELHLRLREKFLEDLDDSSDQYEESDIEKVKNDDWYCKRFILHKKGQFDEAHTMMKEALEWRKSFGVKTVTEESIPIEFFQAKAVFPYNTDKEGNPIILILVRFHKRNSEYAKELRRFVIYWVEKMEEQSKGGQMTVVMSCAEAGLSNLDLDLIKFLITLFRSYYPNSLAHILIFEMPWIFNAAWKIIKAWLPEDFVEKIKFVNKTSITDYINKENLLPEMGGTCTLEYEPPNFEKDVNSNSEENRMVNVRKRVHFSQKGRRLWTNTNKVNGSPPSPAIMAGSPKNDSTRMFVTDDYCIIGDILKISPALELVFAPSPAKNEINEVVIKLTCVSEKPVTFKVKTNNLESYRVKPSIGIIQPDSSIDVTVFLVQGFYPQPIDKFLIMAMEVQDSLTTYASLANLWKTSLPSVIADHKLKCVIQVPESAESERETMFKNMNNTITSLAAKVDSLESQQKSMQTRQMLSLYLLILLALSFWAQMIFASCDGLYSTFERFLK